MSVLNEIEAEVNDSIEKHGLQDKVRIGTKPTLHITAGWTAEQFEAAIKHRVDTAAEAGKVTWAEILLEEVAEVLAAPTLAAARAELIQVAAVAVKMIDRIDQKGSRA
jgi:hypothetical protein